MQSYDTAYNDANIYIVNIADMFANILRDYILLKNNDQTLSISA